VTAAVDGGSLCVALAAAATTAAPVALVAEASDEKTNSREPTPRLLLG
jgi:hypothetical protein